MTDASLVVPQHLAIIMDGNGRWAKTRGWPRVKGHQEGVHSVRAVTRHCRKLGVKALTLYSFSTENWQRPKTEVTALMGLLLHYLKAEREEILGNEIRLAHSGDVSRLPGPVHSALVELERASARNTGMVLNLALNYGSRQEILGAVKSIAADVQSGRLRIDDIDEATVSGRLDTAGLPELDLVVRTSGEMRVSNFLLWQLAYAELVVTPTPWPDFREAQLEAAFVEFGRRQRRFGATGEQVEKSRLQKLGLRR